MSNWHMDLLVRVMSLTAGSRERDVEPKAREERLEKQLNRSPEIVPAKAHLDAHSILRYEYEMVSFNTRLDPGMFECTWRK